MMVSQWSVWSAWSSCSSTCGIMQRTRVCSSLLLLNCIGSNTELMFCSSQDILNLWSAWSSCSTLCGYGIMNRTREYCIFPAGVIGKAFDSVPCFSNSSCEDSLILLNEMSLQSDHLLSTLNNFFDEFVVSFDVYFNKASGLGNVLQILDNFGKECIDVTFFYGSLNIFSGIKFVSYNIGLNSWNSIQISQLCNNGNYSNTITVNDTVVFADIIQPNIFSNISVFTCLGVCMTGAMMKNFSLVSYTHVIWSQWSEWSNCNLSLISTRTRICNKNQWIDCIGLNTEMISCNISYNALWTPWTVWSNCSVLSGTAFSMRTRECNISNSAESCFGNIAEIIPCSLNISSFALWTPWTVWSNCSVLSGTGFLIRTRECNISNSAENCSGNITEVIPCFSNISSFALWTPWTVWSNCSVLSGTGFSIRTRECNISNSAENCSGNITEVIPCFSNITSFALWTPWKIWSNCSVLSETGFLNRTRECNISNSAENCSGNITEFVPCFSNISNLALWNLWSDWSKCNVSYGYRFLSRTRECNISNGTNMCFGNNTEIVPCYSNISNYNLEEWAVWSDCSVTCGLGFKKSYSLKYTGNGVFERLQSCIVINCPVDGLWSKWKEFECLQTLSGGIKLFTRSCDNPSPAYFGLTCMGVSNYTQECSIAEVYPVNGGWSQWSSWSLCTQPCQGGVRSRFRDCSIPFPKYGGLYCNGSTKETISCPNHNCKKLAVNLMVFLPNVNFIDQYSDPTTDPSLALKDLIYSMIEKLHTNNKLNVSFFVALNSLQEQL
nr:A disintegrin and metalloproteinase with thrombospondin motifs adt-1 isoform X2 [Hydra vulgaris]